MADQTARVLKDGIHFGGEIFIAPELARVGGRTVQVRYTPHDLRAIEIFTADGWLCTAHPQDVLTREQADAVIARATPGRTRDGSPQGGSQPQGAHADRAADGHQ